MNIESPADDGTGFPTLGPQVVEWMETNLVFGPGDLVGTPYRLDAEQQAFIWRFYELYPKTHALAGRRRFRRCALSLPKGLRKTELAAAVAAAELSPDAPVRFNGWQGKGLKHGKPVMDPYVVMVAYTEEQSNELAYGALCTMLGEGPLGKSFDIGLERIVPIGARGKAVSVAGSPNATDGARTTFQLFDETHRMMLPKQKAAHQTMMANLPKRSLSDAWALETTTAPEPGTGSVAEDTMEYARAVVSGKVKDSSMFFFHRQASDHHDLTTPEGVRAAVIEASGPSSAWRNIDAICSQWEDPTSDRAYLERTWTNRLVQAATQAFDVEAWRDLAQPHTVADGALITLGFDGGLFHDSTALVATEIRSGHQWMPGLWERPMHLAPDSSWQVPAHEVDAVVHSLFKRFKVYRLYADPPYWQSWIAKWAGEFGEEAVIEWWTNRRRIMSAALENYDTAIREGTIHHDGNKDLLRHVANARRQDLKQVDEQGRPLYLIRKERPDSPHKIDAAMASVLSWEARTDAVKAGVLDAPVPEYQVLVYGGRRH